MEVTRRSFLKRGFLLGASPVAAGLASTAAMAVPVHKKPFKLANVQEAFNICCYCSGGCGTIVSARNGELINIEGDPDHPVNLGGLCPKGSALWGLRNIVTPDRKTQINPGRVLYPMVRRPGKKDWERISWDEAMKPSRRRRTASPSTVRKALRFSAARRSTTKNAGFCRSSPARSVRSRSTTRPASATRRPLRASRLPSAAAP